ncbi:MAG: hypothetical protein EOO73_11785 [Myxococcales bacterium]|nr:MAG: hypothetical protein EOO73_11785 [Myxococcales bacterium]
MRSVLADSGRGAIGRAILTMDQAFACVLFRASELDARSIWCRSTRRQELSFTIGNLAAVPALQAELTRDLPASWEVTVAGEHEQRPPAQGA